MPKQLKELKIFKEGLISNASNLDIPDEAAAYSENIDANIEGGSLGGIANDSVLGPKGFGVGAHRQFYLDLHIGWENSDVNGTSRKLVWGSPTKGFPDSSYFILFTQEGMLNYVIQLDTDRDIENHTVRIAGEEVPLMDLAPNAAGTALNKVIIDTNTAMPNDADYNYDVFRANKVTAFANAWNANASVNNIMKATIDTSGSNRRVILTPLVWEDIVNHKTYNQYGDSVMIPMNADRPASYEVDGSPPDQILEVYKDTKHGNVGSPGSDAGFTTIRVMGLNNPFDAAVNYCVKISNSTVLENKLYTTHSLDHSNDLVTLHTTATSDDLYGANAAQASVITNGDFSEPATLTLNSNSSDFNTTVFWEEWDTHSATVNWQFTGSDNKMQANNGAGNISTIAQQNILEKDRFYKYSITVSDYVSGEIEFHTTDFTSCATSSPAQRLNRSSHAYEDTKFGSNGTHTGIFKATGKNFAIVHRANTTNLKFTNIYITPANATYELAHWSIPFDISIGVEGNGVNIEASDISTIIDKKETDLIAFDKESNSISVIQNVDGDNADFTTPTRIKEGINHNDDSQFLKINKEVRLGLGPDRTDKPLWVGKINRGQLDKTLNGYYVENQELNPANDDLAGYNFDKVIVPYLPPADEMGKRWYQSQLIDMALNITDGGGGTPASLGSAAEYPAYQCTLATNNLGNVVLNDGTNPVTNNTELKACFDCGAGSAHNWITAALNNAPTGTTATYARPFTGLTFVVGGVGTVPPLLTDAKRKYWYGSAEVVVGDVYMVTKLNYDVASGASTCQDVDFLYMGNVAQTAATTVAKAEGHGPAFAIGMNAGQQNLTMVNLWPNPDTGSGAIPSGVASNVNKWSIPLKAIWDNTLTGEICAMNWSHSYMSDTPTGAGIRKKINKKYGTITFAQNDEQATLYRFDLHNAINDNDTSHGPENPKISEINSIIYLDFSKIPETLTQEGNKIVDPPPWDSNMADSSWERIPKAGIITDIMDTWNRRDVDEDGSGFKYFHNDGTTIKGSYEPNGSYLTWIMYGKTDSETATFNRWDMFLYNYEASGTTACEEKVWLNPNDTGTVYVKDRTPPYAECNRHSRDRQWTTDKKTMYYNRERFGVGNNDSPNLWTGTDYPGGVYGNDGSTSRVGDYLYWRHNKNESGANHHTSWVYSQAGNNDNHPENYLSNGRNIGWYNGEFRQIDVHKNTLTRYEPRFEVVMDYDGTKPIVAHNQGHRVMFAGNVSGTFVKYGGKWKPAEGWQTWFPDANDRWWAGDSNGSLKVYSDSLNLFTIKEVSCKTYENPTDIYGSGGERELGSASAGGTGVSTHAITPGQNSYDNQNSLSTADTNVRGPGDYIYINRLFTLEKGIDYSGGHNNEQYASGINQVINTGRVPYGTYSSGNPSNGYANSNGVSVTRIVYNGNGSADGDYVKQNTGLSGITQYNTMYQLDPIVTMNEIENPMTNHTPSKIYGIEPILVWKDNGGANNNMNDYKRLIVVHGQAIPTDADEGAGTFIATYSINNHNGYSTQSPSTIEVPNINSTFYNDAEFVESSVLEFENSLKGTNINTASVGAGNEAPYGGFTSNSGHKNAWSDVRVAEIDSLTPLSDTNQDGAKVYAHSRLSFINTSLHFQGYPEEIETGNGEFGTGAYNPVAFGTAGDLQLSVVTKVKETTGLMKLKDGGTNTAITGAVITTADNDLNAAYFDQIDSLFTFDMDASTDGEGFDKGSRVYYKISMVYDGFQESPLSVYSIETPILTVDKSSISGTFNVTSAASLVINPRVTHVNLYFTDDLKISPWTLAKSIPLDVSTDRSWVFDYDMGKYRYKFNHGTSGATYETLNGISSNRRFTMVNWGLATKMGNYTVYGNCSHPKIKENISNYLFRSKAGRSDIIDWVNDYLILPSSPIAIQGFRGKLYAWDDSTMYVINQEGFYVEDVLEGIGILNKKAVVATDYGMCFADSNNIYLHDGVKASPIGTPILRNTLKRNWRVGYLKAVEICQNQGHDINVLYDGENNSFVITTKGFCQDNCSPELNQRKGARAYIFSLDTGRWDYSEIPNVLARASGRQNSVYLIDGQNVYNYRKERAYTREWEWFSKNMSFGADTQLKSFTKIKITGSPSSVPGTNIKAYVDGAEKTLTVERRNYSLSPFSATLSGINNTTDPVYATYSGTDSERTYSAGLRKGMYIKVEDEIMLITEDSEDNGTVTIKLSRGQLGTVAASHGSVPVYNVGPSFKLPSGTKGNKLRFELLEQTGLVDSVGIIYRGKNVK